jgi:CrcB protein
MFMSYVWVAVGSALGGIARFWLTGAIAAVAGSRFPWGTLLINMLGSMVIGATAGVTIAPARVVIHPDMRVFVMVGLCGGFTTFSAFSLQTLELLQSGDWMSAGAYVAGSVGLCLLFAWLGWCLAQLQF